jgi:hypothetical protein
MRLKLSIEELYTGYAWLRAGICRQPIWRPATVPQVAIEQMRGGDLAVSVCDRMDLIRVQNWAKSMYKDK